MSAPIQGELFGEMVVRVLGDVKASALVAVKTAASRADDFLGQFNWYPRPWN